ncbi:MAG: formylmethanofuran dehydrogenase subunit B [Planctomycetes bacterium]|nr:formylmethanofuran dehydrogenase subunit B [Planctomycetota bacterium]
MAQSAQSSATKTFSDVVCVGCGCLCDDICVTVRDNRVVEADPLCELGRALFFAQPAESKPAAFVDGHSAEYDEAIDRAADVLRAAQAPLVCGLCEATCEAQQAAVALADRIGAIIDPIGSDPRSSFLTAVQQVGLATCTLGELRHRADRFLLWRANPAVTHPRFFQRYGPQANVTLLVIDEHPTDTARVADEFLLLRADGDFDLVWALRAVLHGLALPHDTERRTGLPLTTIRRLAEFLQTATYGVVVLGGGWGSGRCDHLTIEAILVLVRELNRFRPWRVVPLVNPANQTGAENVLAWSTGYPAAVDLRGGCPRANPGEFSAVDVLSRGEVDAAVIVGAGSPGRVPAAARSRLATLATIVIGGDVRSMTPAPTVAFPTARPGLEAGGIVHRMDGVPLSLRPVLSASHKTDAQVLDDIKRRIEKLQKGHS